MAHMMLGTNFCSPVTLSLELKLWLFRRLHPADLVALSPTASQPAATSSQDFPQKLLHSVGHSPLGRSSLPPLTQDWRGREATSKNSAPLRQPPHLCCSKASHKFTYPISTVPMFATNANLRRPELQNAVGRGTWWHHITEAY